LIKIEEDPNVLSIKIPEIFDNNGDIVSLAIESELFGTISTQEKTFSTEYMSFNNETRLLQLSLPLSTLDQMELSQELTFTLTDNSESK